MKFENLDANESIFFARELEHIKTKTFDVRYPQFKATTLIPVSNEAGSGAETITYNQFDQVGFMKIIADYADDLPRSDVKGKQFTSDVHSIGGSYGYSIQEIRNAQQANKNLVTRKAISVRRAYDQEVNDIAWNGDGTAKFGGLFGLWFNPNITKATPTTGAWLTGPKTPDQIIADVNESIFNMRDLTLGVEEPNMIVLPVKEYGHIAATPRTSGTDTTILSFLQNVNPMVEFTWLNEAKGVIDSNGNKPSGTAGATNVMLTYMRDPDKLTLEIPQDFETFAPQMRNLEFVVNAHGRIGGVIVYYPLSLTITEDI